MSAGYQAGDAPVAEGAGGRLLGVYIETDNRRGALKSASYHFEQDCSYISYQGADLADDELGHQRKKKKKGQSWKLADGSSLPDQRPFEDTSWNPATRTFKGTVSWDPSFAGSIRWEYEMIFSADFSFIEKGSFMNYTTGGPGIGGGHDMQLSYGETGSFGLMYKKVAAGLEANYRPLDAKLRKEKEEKEKAEDQKILDAGCIRGSIAMALTPYAEMFFPSLMECMEGGVENAAASIDKVNEKFTPAAEAIYTEFAGQSEEMSGEQWSTFVSAFADACLVVDGKMMDGDPGAGAKTKHKEYQEQKSTKDNELFNLIAKGGKVGRAELTEALTLGKCDPVPPPTPESMMKQMGIVMPPLYTAIAITSEG